jgi:DNA polymerase III gamma/tau subunit
MDGKEAKKNLQDLKESLEKILGDDGLKEEASQHSKAAKAGARTLLDRLKEFPVVEKISSLGTAGTMAVGTAAVAQTELAVTYTELVVAQVAEDVYEGVIEPPAFFESFVDFDDLHSWGQEMISERVAAIEDPTGSSVDVDTDNAVDTKQPNSVEPTPTQEPSKEQAQEKSEESKQPSKNNEETESKPQEEPKEETKQEESLEESKEEPKKEVKQEIPIVETPIDPMEDDITPHRQVSPTN